MSKFNVDYMNSSSTIPNEKRPYSPNHLTKDDVTDIWFKIFRQFTSAVSLGKKLNSMVYLIMSTLNYPVCHGTGEDRQKLATTLQQKKMELGSSKL